MLTHPDLSMPDDLHVFTQAWEAAQPTPEAPGVWLGRVLVLLPEGGGQEEIRHRLTADHPGVDVVFATPGPGFGRTGRDCFSVGGDLEGGYRELLRTVVADHGPIDAVAHLWATERTADGSHTDPEPLRAFLRAVAQEAQQGPAGVPGRILLGGSFADGGQRCAVESWLGFERSIPLVLPGTSVTVLGMDDEATGRLAGILADEVGAQPVSALHMDGRRWVQQVRPAELRPVDAAGDRLRDGGTYLITGGAGGLGAIFGSWLAREYRARLVIVGRRPAEDAGVRARLAELDRAGAAAVLYRQADVCDPVALTEAVRTAVGRFGRIDGVLHAAGVEEHGSIAERDAATFARVRAPKVAGTVALESALRATRADQGGAPDFVCYFSSSAAVLGDFGSGDYAGANRFQVAYAEMLARSEPAGAGRLAISWPLWRSDGMNFSDETAGDFYLRSSGQRYLEPAEGTGLFRLLLAQPGTSYLALAGERDRIRTMLRVPGSAEAPAAAADPASVADPVAGDPPRQASGHLAGAAGRSAAESAADQVADGLRRELNDVVSQILRVPPDKLAVDENFREFGFDSITLVEFAGELTESLGVDVTPHVFFSYPNLRTLHEYLLTDHFDRLADRYRPRAAQPATVHTESRPPAPVRSAPPSEGSGGAEPAEGAGAPPAVPAPRRRATLRSRRPEGSRFAPKASSASSSDGPAPAPAAPVTPAPGTEVPAPPARDGQQPASAQRPVSGPVPARSAPQDEPVSIIGMSGRFPAARDVGELWRNLSAGRGAVGAMPPERREWDDGRKRHVGWVPGIAEFDPLFFEIAPSEAETMDPRQRLLLEEMWKALEDAGCGRQQLSAERVGVFVGVEEGDYRLLAASEEAITSNHNAVLASRLSYFLNLTGPSLAINTACSSGLVALHEACLSLRHGDCDTAIVASANLMATPRDYDGMEGAGMLSAEGVCRAFGSGADGMVPGEAVAAVVLKRRDGAARQGLRGYASILASGINNDGRTNGITAPNGLAQTRLLREVHERAGISPETLGHIVTHGTGTRLGDPVEIHALAEAFRPHTDRTGFAALTSTKPNLGHSLAASGLVSLISLVAGMWRETIPPSINCEEISDFVDWGTTPFYVNRERRPWPGGGSLPRHGAVSAFGFSGTNAHVVVESNGTERGELARIGAQPAAPSHLLVLSAKTETALVRQMEQLADHLAGLPDDTGPGLMASVSRTLVVGRHHFARRCALVVGDRADAVAALRRAAAGQAGSGIERGVVPRGFDPTAAETRELSTLVARADGGRVREGLLHLARAYCLGHEPAPLAGLWGATPPSRVHLPTYAFDNADYWVTRATETTAGAPPAAARLHPLVHRNVSDMSCQRFAAAFTGRESWFEAAGAHAAGEAGGGALIPGALLEQARAAVVLGLGGREQDVTLREVVWYEQAASPAGGSPTAEVRVDLRKSGENTLDWAVFCEDTTDGTGEMFLVCDGSATVADEPAGDVVLPLTTLRTAPGAGRLLLELPVPADESSDLGMVLRPEQLQFCVAAARRAFGWGSAQGDAVSVGEARLGCAARSARWALVTPQGTADDDTRSLTVELAAEDGTVVATVRELVLTRAADTGAPSAGEAAGDGRRAHMRGWTVEQCLAWELADAAGQVLKVPADQLDPEENLANYGLDSLNLAKFTQQLSGRLGVLLTPDRFFSHPTLRRLEGHLLSVHAERMNALYRQGTPAAAVRPAARRERRRTSDRFAEPAGRTAPGAVAAPRDEPIAVVGLAGRFPDARNVDELWSIVSEGRSVVRDVPDDRRADWSSADEPGEDGEPHPRYAFGSVPGIAEFDPLFFEMSPREAELVDPRQRLLMQEMWRALEDAGYGETTVAEETIGIFVGAEEGDYRYLVDGEDTVTSNSTSILASRLAYFLNLSGPSLTINTACSSGLVALHEACLSLRHGDCDTAIVAGVSLMSSAHDYVVMDKANMLSPDRTCYAFDQRANGMVPGEAVAVLVLKKQQAAERDGQRIHATVLGTGINYDGRTSGITAPSGAAQTRLLGSVYDRYRIAPDSLDYVVTHGTGTRLGDPVEINALADAFAERTDRTGYCALTSVKPNIGHSMAASGLVSLICLMTAMRHETIPPSINCEEPSDYIEWEKSPFYVNRRSTPWPCVPGRPRRGAVSSFGVSGTNAHVVLEAPAAAPGWQTPPEEQQPPRHQLLLVSAKTQEALGARLTDLADHLEGSPHDDGGYLASVSRTLITGRFHFAHRCAVIAQDRDDAVRLLREAAAGAKIPNVVRGTVSRDFRPNGTVSRLIDGLVRASRAVWHDAERHQDHLAALAEFYSQGYTAAFSGIWENRPPLVSLPGYPFATDRYWAPSAGSGAELERRGTGAVRPAAGGDDSDGTLIQRFSSQFTGREAFLNDLLIPIENTSS
ncbi:SDR family NAD(P)-dependent oxidoreductase [Streptomyces sp. SH5]|uniref:SDR family NAD(P)-dependent oxidoreductase n=1 Tax=Streptomyces sp. SH5 TaxID=3041765 RepID=UPI0024780CD8|nr:SDR family NAD(P)-dependent oxidoreductase [Streptomyces sp. SH5]WGP11704.1 SDR family NAD(P)-dependent oxidoreductase [Streptomyces sp. SH5]